jgi:Tol biopolymer transport system component
MDLRVMDRDGGNEHSVERPGQIPGRSRLLISGFAWSPDGSRLAVTRPAYGLFLVSPSGDGEWKLILATQTADESRGIQMYSSPSWSPDGKKIAFFAYSRHAGAPGVGNKSTIHVVNVDGSGDTQVSSSETPAQTMQENAPISWSRDGKNLYFTLSAATDRPSMVANAIHRAKADGTEDLKLTGGFDPKVSPDGRRIVFSRPARAGGVFLMNEDGTGIHQVTNDPDWRCLSGEWSPDGTQLLLSCSYAGTPCKNTTRNGCDWRIFLISTDNPPGKLTPLIDRDARYPRIAPGN